MLPGFKILPGMVGRLATKKLDENVDASSALIAPTAHEGPPLPGECSFLVARLRLPQAAITALVQGLASNTKVPFHRLSAYRKIEEAQVYLMFYFLDTKGRLVTLAAVGPEESFPTTAVEEVVDGLDLSDLETLEPARPAVIAAPSPRLSAVALPDNPPTPSPGAPLPLVPTPAPETNDRENAILAIAIGRYYTALQTRNQRNHSYGSLNQWVKIGKRSPKRVVKQRQPYEDQVVGEPCYQVTVDYDLHYTDQAGNKHVMRYTDQKFDIYTSGHGGQNAWPVSEPAPVRLSE